MKFQVPSALRLIQAAILPGSIPEEDPLPPFPYKGFSITPRTFQLRGTSRWTVDLLIGRNGRLRAFGDPSTYPTEAGAVAACKCLACRIIDGAERDRSVADLG